MSVRRSAIFLFAVMLVLLAGCGQVSTSIEAEDAFTPTAVEPPLLSWNIEIVNPTMYAGGPTALALAADGAPRIAFIDSYADLHYVAMEDSVWSTPERIGAMTGYLATSMALDSEGVPHITYLPGDGSLAYVVRTEGAVDGPWSTEPDAIIGSGSIADDNVLMLDANDVPHVVYLYYAGLEYATTGEGNWVDSALYERTAPNSVAMASLALDSNGDPHVTFETTEYVEDEYGAMWVKSLSYATATHDGGQISWQTTKLKSSNTVSYGGSSLALDAEDHPHIAFVSDTGDLMYMTHDGNGWEEALVVGSAGGQAVPRIAIGSDGNPRIVYRSTSSDGLRPYFASFDGSSWDVALIDAAALLYHPISLALDASDRPHITYTDMAVWKLKYVTLESVQGDTTAPEITAVVDPETPDGDDGWYVSDVSVSWTVLDAESELVSVDCTPAKVEDDDPGRILSCSATSAGGTSTESVTIMRDATAPTVAVTGVAAGMVYAPWGVPTAGCETTDETSGVRVAAVLSLDGGPTGDIVATCAGAMDYAGNAGSASVTYSVMGPSAATEVLIGEVDLLQVEGVLNAGQAKGLIKPLDNALRSLKKDNTLDAWNQLGDFIVKVNEKVPPLSEAQASELIASAEAIRGMLFGE